MGDLITPFDHSLEATFMQGAFRSDGTYQIAADSEKNDGPFTCPGCRGPVTLRQGDHVAFHYAHKPGASPCAHGENEGWLHEQTKLAIYRAAVETPGILKARIEYPVGNRVADVALIGVRRKVAVEIQISPMTAYEMLLRMQDHANEGYSTLWVLGRHGIELKRILDNIKSKGGTQYDIKAFETDIFWMTGGVVFIHDKSLLFRAFHLMGHKYVTRRHFKDGNAVHLFDLVDEEREARGVPYCIVTLPPKKRWWEKLRGPIEDPREKAERLMNMSEAEKREYGEEKRKEYRAYRARLRQRSIASAVYRSEFS